MEEPVTASGIETGTPFTLGEFVEAGRERLRLELVVGGKGLAHRVIEPITNRPGLALTGFYEHFAWPRLQVVGQAEQAYLASLDADTRRARIQALFDRKAYCLIFACGMPVPAEVPAIAEAAGAVVLRTAMLTRDFSHACAFVLEALGAPRTRLYGTMVEVAGLGVMLEGEPGLGKSETALGLIKHGNALVADDLTCLRKDVANGVLYGSAAESTRNYMEIRGIGFIHVPSVFGVTAVCAEKQLDLIVTLKRLGDVEKDLDRTGEERYSRTILAVEVPQIIIPVSAGRDLVNLVETAAQQYKLKLAGHDAVKALDARIRENNAAKAARI